MPFPNTRRKRSRLQNDPAIAGGDRAGATQSPAPRILSPEEQRERLLMYAFRALGQRALSEAELRSRMLRRHKVTEIGGTGNSGTGGIDIELHAELVESVLERVRELGYLDDEQVAQAEARRRGIGTGRVRQKLRQRGVDSQLIEEVISARDPEDELEDARTLLERRWPSFMRAADPQKRAFAFMLRRGYSSGLIWPLLREFAAKQELEEEEFEEFEE
jgi:regulatory protein